MKMQALVMVTVRLPFDAEIPTLEEADEATVSAARSAAASQAESIAAETFKAHDVAALIVEEVSEA
jgi:hypothetical protein